jgi:multidrug resistance efflux pump
MKVLIIAAVLCISASLNARAEGETTPAVKAPGETIEVAPESSTGLFERVRDAHIRAVQKGTVTASSKG